ncbi:unnamed protein product, partial [Linum tenue]
FRVGSSNKSTGRGLPTACPAGGQRLRRHTGGPPLRPDLRPRPRRHRPLRTRRRGGGRQGSAGGPELLARQQGGEEEDPPRPPQADLLPRRRRRGKIHRLSHLPRGIHGRGRVPGAPAVRPRHPRGLHRHLAQQPFVMPFLPADTRRQPVSEVRRRVIGEEDGR